MLKTRGISPKVIGPVATALGAFAVDKITDAATESLVVALIGAVAAILLPPGEVEMQPIPAKRATRSRRRAKAQSGGEL